MTQQSSTVAQVRRGSKFTNALSSQGRHDGDRNKLFVYIRTFHGLSMPQSKCVKIVVVKKQLSDAVLRECNNYFDPFTSLPIFRVVLAETIELFAVSNLDNIAGVRLEFYAEFPFFFAPHGNSHALIAIFIINQLLRVKLTVESCVQETKERGTNYLDKYLDINRSLIYLPMFDNWNNEQKGIFQITSQPTVCFKYLRYNTNTQNQLAGYLFQIVHCQTQVFILLTFISLTLSNSMFLFFTFKNHLECFFRFSFGRFNDVCKPVRFL